MNMEQNKKKTIESTEEWQKIDKLERSLSLKEGWTLHSCPFLSEEMLQFAHHIAPGIWAQSHYLKRKG